MRSANKKSFSVLAVVSVLLLAGCGNNNNNTPNNFPFGGGGGGFFGGNCNGVPVQSAIPYRVDGAYLSGNNFLAGINNSPFGSTGTVTVGQSAGGNQQFSTDPNFSNDGFLQASLSTPPNFGGRAVGGGQLQLSQQVVNQIYLLYGNNNNWNNNWWNQQQNNFNNNNFNQTPVCVVGMQINLGVSNQVLQTGARKLYGGNVHLQFNTGGPYSLGF